MTEPNWKQEDQGIWGTQTGVGESGFGELMEDTSMLALLQHTALLSVL